MDRTSSGPNILSSVKFWIRFINFDLEYLVPSLVLYYSKWKFEMRVFFCFFHFFIQYFRLFFTKPPLVAGRLPDGKDGMEVLFQFYLWDQSYVTKVWNTRETGDIYSARSNYVNMSVSLLAEFLNTQSDSQRERQQSFIIVNLNSQHLLFTSKLMFSFEKCVCMLNHFD